MSMSSFGLEGLRDPLSDQVVVLEHHDRITAVSRSTADPAP